MLARSRHGIFSGYTRQRDQLRNRGGDRVSVRAVALQHYRVSEHESLGTERPARSLRAPPPPWAWMPLMSWRPNARWIISL